MFSYWIYVLVGQNRTGKTSFQRYLVNDLCDNERVNVMGHWNVQLHAPRRLLSLFVANRSYQEVAKGKYGSVENYLDAAVFVNSQRPHVIILSSHSDAKSVSDIEEMARQGKLRSYNIAGVFFSNSKGPALNKIKLECEWSERLWIDNPLIAQKKEDIISDQLRRLATDFGDLLAHRSIFQ